MWRMGLQEGWLYSISLSARLAISDYYRTPATWTRVNVQRYTIASTRHSYSWQYGACKGCDEWKPGLAGDAYIYIMLNYLITVQHFTK